MSFFSKKIRHDLKPGNLVVLHIFRDKRKAIGFILSENFTDYPWNEGKSHSVVIQWLEFPDVPRISFPYTRAYVEGQEQYQELKVL